MTMTERGMKFVAGAIILLFLIGIIWLPMAEPADHEEIMVHCLDGTTIRPTAEELRVSPHPYFGGRGKLPKHWIFESNHMWDGSPLFCEPTDSSRPLIVHKWEAEVYSRDLKTVYYVNITGHRGNYVEVRIFSKGKKQLFLWADKGYGDPMSNKFPANPVYTGEWVRFK